MPFVIPAAPPAPTLGQSFGTGLNRGVDLLLQALLSGQIGRTPQVTGGQFQAPTGQTTQISPAERVAPGQQGAGTPLAQLLQARNATGPGAFIPTSTTPGPLRIQPDIGRQLQQAQLGLTTSLNQQIQQALQPPTSTQPSTPAFSPVGTDATATDELTGLYTLALDESDPDMQRLALEQLAELGEDVGDVLDALE